MIRFAQRATKETVLNALCAHTDGVMQDEPNKNWRMCFLPDVYYLFKSNLERSFKDPQRSRFKKVIQDLVESGDCIPLCPQNGLFVLVR